MSTDERDQTACIARALQELLAGREPLSSDVAVLTGTAKACIDALIKALRADGVQAVRTAFNALVKDQPWLGRLASQSPQSSGATEQEGQPTRRIRFSPDSTFENRPEREWLIPTILPKEGIALVFGPPGCGKSFLIMAWSFCVAAGKEWLGRPVLKGPVAYIAGEGGFGIGPRIKAWKTHHGFTGESGVCWFDEPVSLHEAGEAAELITALSEDFASPPVLVIFDTLSRCSSGADENSNVEVAKVIATADVIQKRFHCTVLIIHHTGKDSGKGPRGASALVGNTETIISVDATDEGCRVACYKQKDAEKFAPLSLKMQRVSYGPGENDNSVVLIVGDEASPLKMNKSEQKMYAALIGKELTYSDWTQAGLDYAQKIKEPMVERTAQLAIKSLLKADRVQQIGKLYSITSNQQEEPENDETPF